MSVGKRRSGLWAGLGLGGLALVAGGTAAAAICPACVGGYLPVRGLTASSIGGETAFSLYYDHQRRDTLFRDGRRVANPGGLAVTLRSVTAGADWAATSRWTVGVLVPWVSYEGRLPGPAGVVLRPASSGVGDAMALVRGALWGGRFAAFRGSVTLGVKAPTGARSTTDAAGNLLPPSVQPGTGTWDGFAAVAATRHAPPWTLVSEVAGRAGAEAVGFPAGSNLIASLAASRQVAGLLLGVASLTWRWQDPEPAAFAGGVGAGGWQVDVMPGLQWIAGDHARLEAGVRLPVARRLSGLQLGERYGIIAGGRLVF